MSLILILLLATATGMAQDRPSSAAIAAYRDAALRIEGDANAGRKLFENDKKLVCTNCHRIDGKEKSGPNLNGIGDKYSRKELIRHILHPGEMITPGFQQAIVITTKGKTISGRIERKTKFELRIIDATGKQHGLKASEFEDVSYPNTSLMPDNVVASISHQQFADLITYLQTLRFGVNSGLTAGGRAVAIPHPGKPIQFIPVHGMDTTFASPVWCGPIPGVSNQLVVLEHQQARIRRLIRDPGNEHTKLFVDLSSETHFSPNQGLMCIAFHPDYKNNRRYFLEHEVKESGKVKTVIVERRATVDGLSDSGQPSIRLIELEQPAFNHNGGCIVFGPDGMLYAAFGDGGPQKDPPGYSQDPRILHGSMIRIDVDRKDGDQPYAIPPDNPFVQAHQLDSSIRPETWAIGFREPWRFSFDPLTSDLWLGDVGQNAFEEICLVRKGENHGWNVREAFTDFSDEYHRHDAIYQEPLFAYAHGLGFSVTGGYVYRANPKSSFYGVYIFGDFNTRRIWGLRQKHGKLTDVRELGTAPGGIASFGVDDKGELLVVTYDGRINQLDLLHSEYK